MVAFKKNTSLTFVCVYISVVMWPSFVHCECKWTIWFYKVIFVHAKCGHCVFKKKNAHHRNKYLLSIYNENSVLVTDFSATALDQTPVSSLDHGSVAMSSEGMMQIIPPPAVSVNKSPHGGMPLDNLKSWCQILKFRKLCNYNLSQNLV